MLKEIKTWVTFYSPGSIMANMWDKEIDDNFHPCDIDWPNNAYAFTVHKRQDIVEDDGVYMGRPQQIGPMYYHPDSKVESLEQVKNNPNATDILIRNMECNKWDPVIWTRWGNWPQPFDAERHEILID